MRLFEHRATAQSLCMLQIIYARGRCGALRRHLFYIVATIHTHTEIYQTHHTPPYTQTRNVPYVTYPFLGRQCVRITSAKTRDGENVRVVAIDPSHGTLYVLGIGQKNKTLYKPPFYAYGDVARSTNEAVLLTRDDDIFLCARILTTILCRRPKFNPKLTYLHTLWKAVSVCHSKWCYTVEPQPNKTGWGLGMMHCRNRDLFNGRQTLGNVIQPFD